MALVSQQLKKGHLVSKLLEKKMDLVSKQLPCVPEVFFSLGATELSGEAAKTSREAARSTTRQALLALTLLADGEREDLWYPGYA